MFVEGELEFHYTAPEDLEFLVKMFEKESVCEHLYYGPNTKEQTNDEFMPLIEEINEFLIEEQIPKSHLFTVYYNGEKIGLGGLFCLELSKANYLIGFTVDDKFWGKGFGTKITNFLIDFAFHRLKAYKITGDCLPSNIKSQKIFERFGFQKEGLVRGEYFSKGKYYDNMLFGLLSTEYQ